MGTMGRAIYRIGFMIRETGQALDRLGCRLQGIHPFQEPITRHRAVMNLYDKTPMLASDTFVAPSATIVGDVKIGAGSSIWYGCVLRGDVSSIVIGSSTNIQDHSLIHVSKTNISENVVPTFIGSGVTIGHSAILHGCTVEDDALIGMGATLLEGVYVEKNSVIAAGALVKENTLIPTGEVWGGNPARFLKKLSAEEMAFFPKSAETYGQLAEEHAKENSRPYDELLADKVLRKKWAVSKHEHDFHLGVVHEKVPLHAMMGNPKTSH